MQHAEIKQTKRQATKMDETNQSKMSLKAIFVKHNNGAFGQWEEGEEKQATICTHLRYEGNDSLPNMRRNKHLIREGKLYTLICTLYSMQLRKMAEQVGVPVLNSPGRKAHASRTYRKPLRSRLAAQTVLQLQARSIYL